MEEPTEEKEEPTEYRRGDYKKEIQSQQQAMPEEPKVEEPIAKKPLEVVEYVIKLKEEFDHFNEMLKNPQWVRDQREFERENEVNEVICWGETALPCPKKRARKIIA